jgi:hypothetical protein
MSVVSVISDGAPAIIGALFAAQNRRRFDLSMIGLANRRGVTALWFHLEEKNSAHFDYLKLSYFDRRQGQWRIQDWDKRGLIKEDADLQLRFNDDLMLCYSNCYSI